MSDDSATPPSTDPAPSGSKTRTNVLLVILGLLSAGLVYDYLVARPAVEKAYQTVLDMNVNMNASKGSVQMTREDVQEALGRAPSDEITEGDSLIEVYGWMSGLPFRTHKMFATYQKTTGDTTGGEPRYIFVRHAKFKNDTSSDVNAFSNPPPPTAPSADEQDDPDSSPEDESGEGSTPAGGGGEPATMERPAPPTSEESPETPPVTDQGATDDDASEENQPE